MAPSEIGRLDSCPACGLALPLRLPRPGQRGSLWICACGACYEAVLDRARAGELLHNVRLAPVPFDHARLVRPPQAIFAFVGKMGETPRRIPERRSSPRRMLAASVAVMPLGEDFQPVGEPFVAVIRNISTEGIALMHTRAVDAKYLVVEMPGTAAQVVQVAMKVLRCRALGRFYEIAGSFAMRLGGEETVGVHASACQEQAR